MTSMTMNRRNVGYWGSGVRYAARSRITSSWRPSAMCLTMSLASYLLLGTELPLVAYVPARARSVPVFDLIEQLIRVELVVLLLGLGDEVGQAEELLIGLLHALDVGGDRLAVHRVLCALVTRDLDQLGEHDVAVLAVCDGVL